jgi:hypothetical protein
VNRNNEYLQLIEEENGEYTLETKYYNILYKYFLNQDRIFQVGDKMYKAYSECLISVDESKVEELKNSNFEMAQKLKGSKIKLSQNYLKSTSNCGSYDEVRADSNNERIKQQFSANIYDWDDSWGINCVHIATAYKRVWPIWYRVGRQINADIDHVINVYEEGSSVIRTHIQKTTHFCEDCSILDGYCGSWMIIDKPCGTITVDFDSYNTWSKQENSPKAISICN